VSSVDTVRSTARTAAAGCLVAAVLLLGTAAVFQWSGQPTVIGFLLGAALLVVGVLWRSTKDTPRWLPAATMMIGIVLVVVPFVLDYNDGENNGAIAVAYVTHVLVGLALAALGYWSGKKTGAPRIDQTRI